MAQTLVRLTSIADTDRACVAGWLQGAPTSDHPVALESPFSPTSEPCMPPACYGRGISRVSGTGLEPATTACRVVRGIAKEGS
jgi:hypothetical protein